MRFARGKFRAIRRINPTFRKLFAPTRTRRGRSNRIFRRFVRRRAVRPELKWITQSYTSPTLTPIVNTSVYTTNVTPNVISRGTMHNNRIGNQLNMVKVSLRVDLTDQSQQGAATAPVYQTYMVRLVLWTPRAPIAAATTYMNSLTQGMYKTIDFDTVTVHRDVVVHIAPAYIAGSTLVLAAGGNARRSALKKFEIKFPRKVKFGNDGSGADLDTLDPDKDVLYMSIMSEAAPTQGTQLQYECKVWYFDA